MTHDIEARRWWWTFCLGFLSAACAGGDEPLGVRGGKPAADAAVSSPADVSTDAPSSDGPSSPDDSTGSRADAAVGPTDGGADSGPQWPLLGSAHGGHV